MKINHSIEKSVLQKRLYLLQNIAYEKGISFYIIIEGWAQSGKGSVLKNATYRMDPKKLRVYSPLNTEDWDSKYPFQYKYWNIFPPKGFMLFLLKSWYYRASFGVWRKDVAKDRLDQVIKSIIHLEKILSCDGIFLIKFFLDLEKEELTKRIIKAEKEGHTWEVTLEDKAQVKEYNQFCDYFKNYIQWTDQSYAPWIRLSAKEPQKMEIAFMQDLVNSMEIRLSIDSWELLKSLNAEET